MPDTDKQLHTGEFLDLGEFIEYVINEGHELEYPLATKSLLLAATFSAAQSEFEDGYGSVQDLKFLEENGLLSSRIIKSEKEIEDEQLGEDAQVGEPYYDTTFLGYVFGEIITDYLQSQLDKFNGVNALAGLNPDGVAELVAAAKFALQMIEKARGRISNHAEDGPDYPLYHAQNELHAALANVKGGV